MANPNLDRELAIRALLDADVSGDRIAAKRHGITERTLRRWRTRLESDPELTAAYRRKNAAADRSWKAIRREALCDFIREMRARVKRGDVTFAELLAGTKTLGDIELTQEALGNSDDAEQGQGPPEGEGRGGPGASGEGRLS